MRFDYLIDEFVCLLLEFFVVSILVDQDLTHTKLLLDLSLHLQTFDRIPHLQHKVLLLIHNFNLLMQNSRLVPKKRIVLRNQVLKGILYPPAEVATPAQIKSLFVHGVEK